MTLGIKRTPPDHTLKKKKSEKRKTGSNAFGDGLHHRNPSKLCKLSQLLVCYQHESTKGVIHPSWRLRVRMKYSHALHPEDMPPVLAHKLPAKHTDWMSKTGLHISHVLPRPVSTYSATFQTAATPQSTEPFRKASSCIVSHTDASPNILLTTFSGTHSPHR